VSEFRFQHGEQKNSNAGCFMTTMDGRSRLKILVFLQGNDEANALQSNLECLGHRVLVCHDLVHALKSQREWQPDLLITEEVFGRVEPNAGIRLAESCGFASDQINGWRRVKVLVLIAVPDWDRFKRLQRTGAHVVVKGTNFETTIRYVQTVADNLVTDRTLGPAIAGIHASHDGTPRPKCDNCAWVGASISYGASQTDLLLTPVRTALLNVLLFRRRGQSAMEISNVCHEFWFLKKILRGHELRESAVKMEIARLRQDIGNALEVIGAPYIGEHFLPFVRHGAKTYALAGNWCLIHIRGGNAA